MRTVSVSFNIYVSSKVGAEGMGLLSLTTTVYGFAITLATSGINLAVVRLVSASLPYDDRCRFDEDSNKKASKIMKNALLYCLFFSLLASVLLFCLSGVIGNRLLGDKRTVSSLRLLAFTLTPISISSALNGYFCAVRRVYKNVIVQFCEQLSKIFVVTALLLLIGPIGIEYACIAVCVGGALSEGVCVIISAVLYFFDRRMNKDMTSHASSKNNFIFNLSKSKGVKIFSELRESYERLSVFPIAFPVALSAYVRSALLTIEHLAIPWGLKKSGASAVSALASYGTLHGMVLPILLFPSAVLGAFSSLLVPELSSAHSQRDTQRIKSIVSRVFFLALLFSIGVSGIFICFSHEIGVNLYGSYEASQFIKMLAPLIPLMYLDGAVDAMLKGLGEHLYTMKINIIDSLLSVILIVALLPSLGIKGYVTVIFVMELFNTSFSIFKLMQITDIKPPLLKWIGKPLFSVIISTFASRLIFDCSAVSSFLITTFGYKAISIVEIALTSILYLTFTRLLGAVTKNDLLTLRYAIKS